MLIANAMRLAERLTGAPPPASPVTSSTTISAPAVSVPRNSPAIAPRTRPTEKLGEGVFATVDDAVDAARAAPGVFGARMTGGGFGGCAIVLARSDAAAAVGDGVASAFESRFGRRCPVLATAAAAGAG